MRSLLPSLALALLAGLAPACAPSPEAPSEHADALTDRAAEPAAYYVVLAGPSAAALLPRGVDARSPAAARLTRARVAEIAAEHAAIEPALVKEGAQVIAGLSRLANAIQVVADASTARRIERLPGVLRVERAPRFERALGSAVPLIGATKAWSGTPMLQGDGITIGIIDSGIDYTHADFGGPGTTAAFAANDGTVIEPGSFPTAKVIGGWDFVGDAYDASGTSTIPKPDADPLDCASTGGGAISGGHGTHVAGIAAGMGVLQDGTPFTGPYEASFDPSVFRVAPGVAPRANLYALRIFGCEGSTEMLASALDRAVDPNDDGAFNDRLDVVNLSLGTAYGLGSPLTATMIANLTKAGTLVVAAAGNEGQNFFATSSPGSYPEVLSVAASVDNELLTFEVTAPASAVAQYPAAEASFTVKLSSMGPLAGAIVAATPPLGCTAFTNAPEVTGKIALIDRGSCTFLQKLQNAATAGAIAAVVVDDQDALLPFSMGGADPGSVSIPGFMLTNAHGAALKQAIGQGQVTVAVDPANRYTGLGAELLAGLSSRGPSPTDGRFKPEIAAPGVSIDSAGIGTGADPANMSGTSMASPMVAGAAALVREARPAFSPFEVKAALVNTTAPLRKGSGEGEGTSATGSGRVDVARAAATEITAAADPATGDVGVSFGAVVAAEPTTVKRTFVVTNHGASAVSLDASVQPTFTLPGLAVTVSPAEVQLAAGESATVELTLSLDPAALGDPGPDPGVPAIQGQQSSTPRHYLNEASGVVRLSAGGDTPEVVVPYNGSVRAAAHRKGVPPSICAQVGASPDAPVEIAIEGESAHPTPVVSAFQLGALDDAAKGSDTDPIKALTDLRAVGVATDLATAATYDDAQVFFGVAIEGTWTTPARGPVSVVVIEINTDKKGSAEYAIRVEARNADPPYRDALVAGLYDLDTGLRVDRLPINILTPDVARTHPFHNSVLVLSARLSAMGIDPENPAFGWAVTTENPETLATGARIKGTFDPSKPIVDTARFGMNGAPIFLGQDPVKVQISPEARAAGAPIDVLLLHHTNVAGERWEVVSVPTKPPPNLALTAEAPAAVAVSASTTVSLVVTNQGTEPAPAVTVKGDVLRGALISAQPAQGTCDPGATLRCALGEIAAGASVAITATVRPFEGSGSVALTTTASSDLACEAKLDDNTASAAIDVRAAPSTLPDLYATGGCACHTGGGEGEGNLGWLAAALGLLAMRRRRG